ncbi:conserved unknown protein [Ectocarpus siliculosus]|uniref:Rieske domain-containing protein n=1 Tax=Ectocarpus siliculosus TaxID=2880 RepID=D8LI27_ECTSI|nr:conserved unknown protein [Ectocarpus siliculosus]|eukprot:CBN79363.1 conserved unknown protein [Ectocarpus siliculosus]
MMLSSLLSCGVSVSLLAACNGFVTTAGVLPTRTRAQASQGLSMAASGEQWVPILPIDEAPTPGTAKSVYVADLDLCVAADERGLLYVLGNKCPPANQPLSFSLVSNNIIKDPVLGTKIDIETGDVIEWCPNLLGKLLSPILGAQPENAGVQTFVVRQKGGNLEAKVNVNAKAEFEKSYWTGILDAQGKADGGYY